MGNPFKKVRDFVSKAIPKEIKPFVAPVAASFIPLGGSIAGNFASRFLTDAAIQAAITDSSDDIDYIGAGLSGLGGALAGLEQGPVATSPASQNVQMTTPPGPAQSTPTFTPESGLTTTPTGIMRTGPSELAQATQAAADFTSGALTPGSGAGGSLKLSDIAGNIGESIKGYSRELFDPRSRSGDVLTGLTSTLTGASLTKVPAGIKAAKDAEEEAQRAIDEMIAQNRASAEAFQAERKSAYLGTFARRGIDAETTARVMSANGIEVSKEEVEYDRAVREGRTEAAQGGRIGFDVGGQTDSITIGDFIKAEEARTEFLDKIGRKMQALEFNMTQDMPGPLMRNLNMLNPFDKDPTGQMGIYDMKMNYMNKMNQMQKQRLEDMNRIAPTEKRKDDFESYVKMIDKNFPAKNNTEGRQFANKGGRMTPEGDPISPDVPAGMQMDLRGGGFIPLGTKPRADDVPAMVGKNEFVLNDRAVSGIGKMLTGNPDPRAGARALYELQENMEAIV